MSNTTLRDVLAPVTARVALAVVAHPDDESFGLGATSRRLPTKEWMSACSA
jgi:LmbE family N-acetylglucosaminyl deacetylase